MLNTFTDRLATLSSGSAGQALLIAVVTGLLILLGSQGIEIYQAARFAPTVKTVTAIKSSDDTSDYNGTEITDRNLFGDAPANRDQLRQSNLPITSLDVTLRGVFTSSDPRLASAIIQGPDGATRSFKANAQVFGNTRLHAVFNDRIVLTTDGELETLYFPDPAEQRNGGADQSALSQVPVNIQQLVQNNMTQEEIRQAAQQLNSSAMTPEQRKELIRQRLLELRNRARETDQ